MKKYWIQMSIFAVAVTFLVFYYMYLHWTWRQEEMIDRAQIAKMLCALEYNNQMLVEYEDEMNMDELPEDVSFRTWYAKYVSIVLNKGWMTNDAFGRFEPGRMLTYGDLNIIMNAFYLSEDMLSFSVRYRQSDAMVTKAHWCEVYSLLCVNQKRINKAEYSFIASPSTRSELHAWEVETDEGIKKAEGLVIDAYLSQRVEVFEAEEQILCVIRIVSKEEVSKNNKVLDNHSAKKLKTDESSIRVILQSEDFDYDHNKVILTSDMDFYVQKGTLIETHKAGDVVEYGTEDMDDDSSDIILRTINNTGSICVLSLVRACGSPEYKGNLFIRKGNNGLWIINEVELEDYVAGVISSEMPASYGIEALKAQAVCARTYAVKSMEQGFQAYPADVDDTVSSQVYNNQLINELSVQAAYDTKGMILKDIQGISDVYFFSTSCGHTSAPEDVWYDGTHNKDATAVTAFLSDSKLTLDLSKEFEFRAFINQEIDADYYEKNLPWFRWEVFISNDIIEEQLESVLGIDIGKLMKAEVIDRAESGIIKALSIEGDLTSCVIYGEYRIRQIFSPKYSEITQNNGDTIECMTLLPSGYFYLDSITENSSTTGYLIRGGGYGHGCGMSQNGAMKMAESGKNYENILASFFPDSSIGHISVNLRTDEKQID